MTVFAGGAWPVYDIPGDVLIRRAGEADGRRAEGLPAYVRIGLREADPRAADESDHDGTGMASGVVRRLTPAGYAWLSATLESNRPITINRVAGPDRHRMPRVAGGAVERVRPADDARGQYC